MRITMETRFDVHRRACRACLTVAVLAVYAACVLYTVLVVLLSMPERSWMGNTALLLTTTLALGGLYVCCTRHGGCARPAPAAAPTSTSGTSTPPGRRQEEGDEHMMMIPSYLVRELVRDYRASKMLPDDLADAMRQVLRQQQMDGKMDEEESCPLCLEPLEDEVHVGLHASDRRGNAPLRLGLHARGVHRCRVCGGGMHLDCACALVCTHHTRKCLHCRASLV